MPAKVKVELINPSTNAVVDTVVADGILPDVHKYISTFGFPYIVKDTPGSNLFWNTAFIYQGIMCNSEQVDSSKSKCMFKPCIDVTARGNYCTDAFTVTASNVTYKMGDLDKRYGYYNNTLSGNTLDKCVKVWEWDQNNGNGNINSICLTNSPAAITYNKNFPEDIVALPATATYPLSGITRYSYFPTDVPQIDSVNNLATNSGDWIQSLINIDLPTSDKIACYQTTKNIVFLKSLDADYTYNGTTYPAKRNEQQADGTYITRVYYKVIDKKWLFKYRQGIFGSENTGNDTEVYHPLATYLSSHIVAHSDGYIDINTGTSQVSEDSFFFNVEDNAYAVLGVSYDKRGANPPKDYDAKVNTSYFFKSRYYVISGDTPALEVFDSVHSTPIFGTGSTNATGKTTSLFTKDKCVILRYYNTSSSRKYNFIEKRTLYEFNLVWRNTLSMTAPANTSFASVSNSAIDQIYGDGKYYAIMYLYTGKNSTNARTAPRASAIIDLASGAIVGYATGLNVDSSSYTLKHVYYDIESPFRIYQMQNTSSYDMKLSMFTNFFTMKCNLPRQIVKTSDYKMRVTVEIIPE